MREPRGTTKQNQIERRRKPCHGCEQPTTRRHDDLPLCEVCQLECILLNQLFDLPSEPPAAATAPESVVSWRRICGLLRDVGVVVGLAAAALAGWKLGAALIAWFADMGGALMGKPKRVLFELIKPTDTFLSGQPYELLAEVRAEHHFDTGEAKIALAWRKGLKPDADGRLMLGKCVRASDLQRELVDFDFVILLNQEVWEDPEFDRGKKLALLDHEMMHAARSFDADGDPVIDSKMRPVWRVRGHDIEEFTAIVDRHGCYKRDLEKFAEALVKRKQSPLFGAGGAEPTQGAVQ